MIVSPVVVSSTALLSQYYRSPVSLSLFLLWTFVLLCCIRYCACAVCVVQAWNTPKFREKAPHGSNRHVFSTKLMTLPRFQRVTFCPVVELMTNKHFAVTPDVLVKWNFEFKLTITLLKSRWWIGETWLHFSRAAPKLSHATSAIIESRKTRRCHVGKKGDVLGSHYALIKRRKETK